MNNNKDIEIQSPCLMVFGNHSIKNPTMSQYEKIRDRLSCRKPEVIVV